MGGLEVFPRMGSLPGSERWTRLERRDVTLYLGDSRKNDQESEREPEHE